MKIQMRNEAEKMKRTMIVKKKKQKPQRKRSHMQQTLTGRLEHEIQYDRESDDAQMDEVQEEA